MLAAGRLISTSRSASRTAGAWVSPPNMTWLNAPPARPARRPAPGAGSRGSSHHDDIASTGSRAVRQPQADAVRCGDQGAGAASVSEAYGCQSWSRSNASSESARSGHPPPPTPRPQPHTGRRVRRWGSTAVPAPRRRMAGGPRRRRRRRGSRGVGAHACAPSPRGAEDHEAGVGDNLEVRLGGLSLAGEVVAEEDRVGHVQGQRLQRAQVHLPAAGDAQLRVGATKRHRRIFRQQRGSAPRCSTACRRRASGS